MRLLFLFLIMSSLPNSEFLHAYRKAMEQLTIELTVIWEKVLEKEMATHSRILAWKIPWTEKPGGLQSMGLQESDTT